MTTSRLTRPMNFQNISDVSCTKNHFFFPSHKDKQMNSSRQKAATLLKARLQYAQIKMKTGLSTESLQKIESAFISSPKQPRRPLPSEYPPYSLSSTPQSRKYKRMLLSATSTQSPSKKRRLREERKEEAKRDEAAFTILMLKSQGSGSSLEDNQGRESSQQR
ncbi:hypothetical protein BD560DRAFT_414961 [Blakeslea trispora]|nr:hypothetical protein BD560DRAFT_414961 [Blakeslea trispora]